jgi:hypothetical protein
VRTLQSPWLKVKVLKNNFAAEDVPGGCQKGDCDELTLPMLAVCRLGNAWPWSFEK